MVGVVWRGNGSQHCEPYDSAKAGSFHDPPRDGHKISSAPSSQPTAQSSRCGHQQVRPRVFYPRVELVVDAHLSAETDLYLKDHELHQEKVLPAVMGLEQMAQAAMAVSGAQTHPIFEDVKFARPIVVGAGTTIVRAAALVESPGRVEVALRTGDTGFSADHFRATCSFESRHRTNLFGGRPAGTP